MTTAVGTSVPTVLAELVTLWQSTFSADADPVSVVYGPRTAATTVQPRLVSILGTSGTNDDDSLGGATASFTERYRVTVVCSVEYPAGTDDDDLRAASEAAAELWRRCRGALRLAPDQAISAAAAAAGVQRATAGTEFELGHLAEPGIRSSAYRWSVDVIAQVSA